MQLMQVYSQKSTSTTLPRKSLSLNGAWLRHPVQVKSGAGVPTRSIAARTLAAPPVKTPVTTTAMATTAASTRNRQIRYERGSSNCNRHPLLAFCCIDDEGALSQTTPGTVKSPDRPLVKSFRLRDNRALTARLGVLSFKV